MQVKDRDFSYFMNGVIIRNNLLNMDNIDLEELYDDKDKFIYFLEGIFSILDYSEGFFYLNDEIIDLAIQYIESMSEMLSFGSSCEIDVYEITDEYDEEAEFEIEINYEEECKDEKIKDYTKEILFYLRHIKSLDSEEKRLRSLSYLAKEESIRGVPLDNSEDITLALTGDADIFIKLMQGSLEGTNLLAVISSTNYFLNTYPKLYKNKEYRKLTSKRISDGMKKAKVFKQRKLIKNSKEVINALSNIEAK